MGHKRNRRKNHRLNQLGFNVLNILTLGGYGLFTYVRYRIESENAMDEYYRKERSKKIKRR